MSPLPPPIRPSDITPQGVYEDRRRVLAALLGTGALGLARPALGDSGPSGAALAYRPRPDLATPDKPTSWEDATNWNNYYEFGTSKEGPAGAARGFQPRPWSVTVGGEVDVKGTYALDDLLKGLGLEDRIYRHRCVEAWSMVIPWVGVPLASLLARHRPTSRARYVVFHALNDPARMPGQRSGVLEWPYVEALRIDEAMHPLTLLATGLYGRELPNQNGAPLRLVVPWKYGFKGIKAIVRIELTETAPRTTWNLASPEEYGFYANVNPDVDHPRWSQKTERRIGGGFFASRQPTLPFNGYATQVAGLYRGLDLKRNF